MTLDSNGEDAADGLEGLVRRAQAALRRVGAVPREWRPGMPRRASRGWSRRCSAQCKSTGVQCRKWALAGLPTCRVHGSASARVEGLRRAYMAEIARYAWRRAEALRALEELKRAYVTGLSDEEYLAYLGSRSAPTPSSAAGRRRCDSSGVP